MPGWMNHKLESRLPGETSITQIADDITHMAEREEELNSLLIKVKEESEKAGLKLNIQKTKIVAASPITLWQVEGGKVEAATGLIFLGSKITADVTVAMKLKDACSLEEKLDKPRQGIKKQRHHFADKDPYSQSYRLSSNHVWMPDGP